MDQEMSFPIPIVIKEEVVSDSEEVHCRLCHKAFASPVALRNHARMDHVEAYESGDPSVWTKSQGDPIVKPKIHTKREQKTFIQRRKQEILSSMTPTSITSLASNNVSYIIVKSDDQLLERGRDAVKKEREVKKVAPKKEKISQPITGPFECVEASSLGADGACHQIFFSCCEYSAHARAEHARRRRAPRCQVCERPLPARPADAAHPYACETCGDGFATSDELQDHIGKFHVKLKPYECGVCHKRFTQQGGVLQHMRMHTGDRPFPCTFCNKAFTQKSGLDQHLRTHTKQKPYRCVVCTKAFIQSVHLKQHMRTHTNVAPFQCGICDKRFKQSSHLNYHLKNHNPLSMTDEQRDKYRTLVGQIVHDADAPQQMEGVEMDGGEVEVESQDMSPSNEVEQVLMEQTLAEEDTYIIGDSYGVPETELF